MRPFIALVTVLAGLVAAHASDDPAADFRKADKALNETFRQIERRLADDPDAKARLVQAQRSWISFRDAECDFQSGGADGGSVAPMVVATCKAALTSERDDQLKAYLDCEEGDLACPVPSE
ncbi:MAG: DUF1311 domain-containing protein [Rhizobiales bacterium]|nr:DUF1311 domain-containing protein [Hyphomicrobiales bacterium]